MPKPVVCVKCALEKCNEVLPGELNICDYGVAYTNHDGKILLKDSLVPLSLMSTNLRHEMNKMLQAIVNEVNLLDNTLTTKHIDLEKPTSRVIGLTIAIDHFVQMMAGVNEFHAGSFAAFDDKASNLADVVKKFYAIHSIIRNSRRVNDLSLELQFDKNFYLLKFGEIFEYIFSILMDNAWKYSQPETTIRVAVEESDDNLSNIIFSNLSKALPSKFEMFSKGTKVDTNSEGFGFGLFWGAILVDYYNNLSADQPQELTFTHSQIPLEGDVYKQVFKLSNVPLIKR